MVAGKWYRDLFESGECSMGISHLDNRSTENVIWLLMSAGPSGVAGWISNCRRYLRVDASRWYSAKTA